jgi:hypothetical protein
VDNTVKKNKLNLILLKSFPVYFTIAATIVIVIFANTSPLFAGEQNQQDSVTIRNHEYRFEITVPKNWTYRKGIKPDPDEGMRSGEASFSMSVGGSEEEPENWNGIVFNSSGTSDNPQPFVSVYAHEKPNQTPEEFAKLFESVVTMYGGKVMNINKAFSVGDASGFDCNYNLFVQCRYVALYKNGMRIIIQYFLPASDPTLFEKYAPEVDEVIKSLSIK